MKLRLIQQPRQQIFQLQARVLSSLDRRDVERWKKVFEQAWANRAFEGCVPMLPTRPERGWRLDKSLKARRELLNTFQTAAFAFDVGLHRIDLALQFENFRQFMRCAREAVRLFDIRIGPPWWVRDREFLEMVYTAVMAQEEPCDEDLRSCLEPYWGECSDVPQWVAESFFDHEHASSSAIIDQCRWHYFEGNGKTVRPDKDPVEANLSMLLNWQVMYQPLFAYDGKDDQTSYRARSAFPHQAEVRRVIRILNTTPRGRPPRGLVATHS